jgi:hypothetical protein
LQFIDWVKLFSGLKVWNGDEVTALTPSAACAGAAMNTGAISARTDARHELTIKRITFLEGVIVLKFATESFIIFSP